MSSTIQIYGRVRPLQKNSKLKNASGRYWINQAESSNDLSCVGFHVPKDDQGLINHQKENFEFSFNKIFDGDASQEEVFDVVAKPVLTSFMEGYNATIFAYGQTGSGKTFTITGGAERYADRGLIPRTLQYIFKEIQKDPHSTYHVHVSYLEIYNEVGYDLLDSNRDAKKLEDLPKVTLQEDSDEAIHLKNLSVVPAANEEEALNLLFVGDTNRMIAETPSNPASSRSHCIFIISITSRKNGEDVIRRSKLHLVDLAGSERVSKTGIDGTLLKEARHINLSLHYLEQVILALHETSKGKRTHVPYRNSMMTSVLRDSLGGNCKTSMIATLAVEEVLIDESISTCRFAKRVALIANHATLNQELDPKLVIARLKTEISRLKAELAIARGEVGGEYTDGLPDYEKARVRDLVLAYLQNTDPDSELVFADFKKIQYSFSLMKEKIRGGGDLSIQDLQGSAPRPPTANVEGNKSAVEIDQSGMALHQIEQIEKLKRLAEHRDNEIRTFTERFNTKKLSEQGKGVIEEKTIKPVQTLSRPAIINPQQSPNQQTAQKPTLKTSIPKLTTEKAQAFEIFKESYPATGWIEDKKAILKGMYSDAKKMGENAQSLRNEIKSIKEQLCLPDQQDESLRTNLASKITEYKQVYSRLRDFKTEVEHLQHLLEQGRIRMTRDFEAWYVEVYKASEEEEDEIKKSNYTFHKSSSNTPSLDSDEVSKRLNQAWTRSSPVPAEKEPRLITRSYSKQSVQSHSEPLESSVEIPQIRPRSQQKPMYPLETTDSQETIIYPIRQDVITGMEKSKWAASETIQAQRRPHSSLGSLESRTIHNQLTTPKIHRPSSSNPRERSANIQKDIEAFYAAREKLSM